MKAGTEDKKKLVTAGVAGVLALGALYYTFSLFIGGSAPAPTPKPAVIVNDGTAQSTTGPNRAVVAPPGNVTAGVAKKVGTLNAQLGPTLHMDAMLVTESLVYSGSGRNIFSAAPYVPEKKPEIVKPIAGARPIQAVQPVYTGPPPIPPPPPINLKFFGTSTSASGVRKAFLLQGDDVFLAAQGDIVQRKYRIVSITPNTILVEDIPNVNKQTLPLIPN